MPKAKKNKNNARIYVEDGIFRRKPGGPLYVRWFDENGRDRMKSTKGKEITVAREVLRKVKEEARLRSLGLKLSQEDEERRDLTVGELIERYRARHESGGSSVPYKGYMKRWHRAFGSQKAAKLTTGQIEDWRREMQTRGLSNATVNRHTAFLRALYNLAIRDLLLDLNPAAKGRLKPLEEGPGRERVIERHEELQIIPLLEPIDRAGFVISLYSGVRQGELLKLRRDDIDFKNKVLKLRKTKAKKQQVATMNSVVEEAVSFLLSHHPHPYLMPGIMNPEKTMSGVSLTRRLQRVCEGLELPPGIDWHTTRHTYLTRLDEIGASTNNVKNLGRHSTVRVTERYMHKNREQMIAWAENLVGEFVGAETVLFPASPAQRGHLRAI